MAPTTLDDLAALLVQLERSDPRALSTLRALLGVSGGAGPMPDVVRGRLPRAGHLDAAPEPAVSADPCIVLGDDADPSILADFESESREYLQASEGSLLRLETEPDDMEAINTVFRAFHTIKGTSAFLGLDPITELAHHAESLLSRARDGEIRCTGGYAGLAFRAVDLLGALLDGVKAAMAGEPTQPASGYAELSARLQNPEAFGISDVERRAAWRALHGDGTAGAAGGDRRAPAVAGGDATVRVRTAQLDRLIEMVGELVIAQSVVAQDPTVRDGAHDELARKVQQAEKIVRELQSLGLGMRMLPLRAHFQKVARLVRDLATKSGKLVAFIGEGADTEIDRTLVDMLGDPLVHMVRNAVDHGVERPELREAAGKPRTGTVRLSAYHADGNVVVELQDDGRGLDRDRIVCKAVEHGLIASGDGLTDAEVFRLIFAPGFSTAEQVTDVSGRGVGMDVVKRNIERAHGRIEIASVPGGGTTFTIRLPLTLAITDGVLVRAGSAPAACPPAAAISASGPGGVRSPP